jgi:hypothetical protein
MKGPWNLSSRGPPNQIKRSPHPLDSYLCMVFCLMSLGLVGVSRDAVVVYCSYLWYWGGGMGVGLWRE